MTGSAVRRLPLSQVVMPLPSTNTATAHPSQLPVLLLQWGLAQYAQLLCPLFAQKILLYPCGAPTLRPFHATAFPPRCAPAPAVLQREKLRAQLDEVEGKLRDAKADRKEDERDQRKAAVVEQLRQQIPGGWVAL